MECKHSLGTRVLAMMLCVMLVLGMLPPATVRAETDPIAKIGEMQYMTMEEALAAVPVEDGAEPTTITLLCDTVCGFAVCQAQNVILELDGKTLTLVSSEGSEGIQVAAGGKLTVRNGVIGCSGDSIAIGIANNGTVVLEDVELYSGATTVYGVKNAGSLTLCGKTEIHDGNGEGFRAAVSNVPAASGNVKLSVNSDAVYVASVLVERYECADASVELNIGGGTFGKITEDGNTAVPVTYDVSGATIQAADARQLALALEMAAANAEAPLTICLTNDVEGAFEVGAARNVVLNLNEKTLTLVNAEGSGIQVLSGGNLTIRNGVLYGASETADAGVSNYGVLVLEDVKLSSDGQGGCGVRNEGSLTLMGQTEVRTAVSNVSAESGETELHVNSDAVYVENLLVEQNDDVKLNITAGTFGNDISAFLSADYECVGQDGSYVVCYIKKPQENFVFAHNGPIELEYADGLTFENLASGGQDTGSAVAYAVVDGDAATVDSVTGLVTIHKAGKVIIEATKGGNEMYLDAAVRYELNIKPAARSAAFEQVYLTVVYGTRSYLNESLRISASDGENTKIVYSIVSGGDIAAVDSATGELTFADQAVGTVVVKATAVGDSCYADCEATFQVVVDWMNTADIRIAVAGDSGDNGWYKSNVTLHAPEGYAIGMSNSMNYEGWSDSVEFTEEGRTGHTVYLRNEQGHISAGIAIAVMIDKTAPTVQIEYPEDEKASLRDWFGTTIFGSKEEVKINFPVTGTDIALVQWSKDDGNTYETLEAEDGAYHVTIVPEYRGHVRVKVTDQAGWVVECGDDGTLVLVDAVTPQLSAMFRENGNENPVTEFKKDENGFINSSAETFCLDFVFSDNNFDLTRITVDIQCLYGADQEGVELAWMVAEDGNSATATLELSARDEYIITANFQDPINSDTREYRVRLFDGTPELKAEAENADQRITTCDGVDYFGKKSGVTVRLSVSDAFFAQGESGVLVNGERQVIDLADWNWDEATGCYTTSLSYDEDGAYEIKTFYTTPWNGEVTGDAYCFVLDTTAPTKISLEYKEITGWHKLLDGLFGFHNGELTVTVVGVRDAVSGVSKVEYSLDGGVTYRQIAESEDGYVFRVAEECRGKIVVKVTDLAQNSMVYGEERIIVLDTTDPVIKEIAYEGEAIMENDPLLDVSSYDPNFSVIFKVVEENLDVAPEAPKVYFKPITSMEWTEAAVTVTDNEDGHTVCFPMRQIADGTYNVKISVQDRFSTVEEQVVVRIDRTAPEIAMKLQETANNGKYYNTDSVTLDIGITEENFNSDNVSLTVEYNGRVIPSYTKDANKQDAWSVTNVLKRENALSLTFREEGHYKVTVSVTDDLGTVATNAAGEAGAVVKEFVIDRTAPNVYISYENTPIWYEVLGKMFGFWDDTIKVYLDGTDDLSGVAKIQYNMDGSENFLDAGQKDGRYFCEVTERGILTVRVVDQAGNMSELKEDRALVVDRETPGFELSWQNDHFVEVDGMLYTNQEQPNIWLTVLDSDTYDIFEGMATVKDNGVSLDDLEWENTAEYGKAKLPIEGEGEHNLTAFIDTGLHENTWSGSFVVDTTAPEMDIYFRNQGKKGDNGVTYYKNAQEIVITITEVNFNPADVELTMNTDRVALGEDGNPVELPDYAAMASNPENWNTVGENKHQLVLEAPVDAVYDLTVNYTDIARNEAEPLNVKFVVDQVAPSVDKVTYSKDAFKEILEEITFGFFQADVQVGFEVSDHTAGVERIDYRLIGTEGKGSEVTVNLSGTLEADENGEFGTFDLPDAFYGRIYVYATDYASNRGDEVNVEAVPENEGIGYVVVDATPPVLSAEFDPVNTFNGISYFNESKPGVVNLTLEESNFYAELFETIIAVSEENFEGEDAPYVIGAWTSKNTTHRQTIALNADAAYQVKVTGADYSRNEMAPYASETLVVDTQKPIVDVKLYAGETEAEGKHYDGDDTTYYATPVRAVVTIVERNFNAEDVMFTITGVTPLGEDLKINMDDAQWSHDEDVHTAEIFFNIDGLYTLDVACTDLAKNEAEDFAELKFDVDNKNPDILVEGLVKDSFNQEAQTVVIKITDANFKPDAEHLQYTITSTNSVGMDLKVGFPNLHDISNWTRVEGTNQWEATLNFVIEANYTIELRYTDLSGHEGYVHDSEKLTVYEAAFSVDYTAPENLLIEYAEPVRKEENERENIYYYNAPAHLILTAQDGISGLKEFVLYVEQQGLNAATTITLPNGKNIVDADSDVAGFKVTSFQNENGQMIVELEILANFNGTVGFKAVDQAGRFTDCVAEKTIVVDNVAPVLKAETKPTQILNAKSQETVALPDSGNAAELENVVLYYADKAEFRFTMTEANFFSEAVVFLVNGDNQKLTWTANPDKPEEYTAKWECVVDGDYTLDLSYTDRSGNKTEYHSQRIVVDTKAPQMQVVFSEVTPARETENRDYYNAVRYATITIVDRNFRAEDVQIMVGAVDVTGTTVGNLPTAYENRGKVQNGVNETDEEKWTAYTGNWRRAGDTYTIRIPFTTDANYTFQVSYQDLVKKEAATYVAKNFTVDTAVPETLTMSYSMSPLDMILDGISFGFYDAQIAVTITAEDDTSGIDHFVYSYINREGVSSVNAELREETLAVAKYSEENRKATATFTIPQSALGKNNQFNGTVQFDAYDRSTNRSHEDGEMGVIVDNISPTATVSFNDPFQTVNGTEYYNGAINGKIVINEANFFSSDVNVVITRDGAAYEPRVNWRDNSADEHIGTFTLDQEGDYIITINYTDKSNNKMAEYKSVTKVVDIAAPSIHVSNVAADSANNDEVYTFTITVEDADANLSTDMVKPMLQGVIRNEDGTHTVVDIDLTDAKVTANEKTVVYTVENISADGIYTLTCTAADMAGNGNSVIVLDDASAHTEVRFSINRGGSNFDYGNDATRTLAKNYFVQNVEHDLVIHEINVDPINEYTVTLNGVKLVQGEDYTTTISGGDNKWSLREYVIHSKLFAEEGEYNVVVSSVDATDRTTYSDVRNLNMSFVVDRTEPSIVIGGLKEEGRYQNNGQIVTVFPSDEGGSLSVVRIELYNTDATPGVSKPDDVLFELEGEELNEYLLQSGGKIEFAVPEGYRQTVHIVCTDYAVDADGNVNTYTQTLSDITVSPNGLMIFYANKPVFYATIGVSALILALLVILVIRKNTIGKKANA